MVNPGASEHKYPLRPCHDISCIDTVSRAVRKNSPARAVPLRASPCWLRYILLRYVHGRNQRLLSFLQSRSSRCTATKSVRSPPRKTASAPYKIAVFSFQRVPARQYFRFSIFFFPFDSLLFHIFWI